MENRKDDLIIIRIEKELKKQFTSINKQSNIKNSQKIRGWIEDYVKNND